MNAKTWNIPYSGKTVLWYGPYFGRSMFCPTVFCHSFCPLVRHEIWNWQNMRTRKILQKNRKIFFLKGISSHHLLLSEEDNSESTSIVDDNSASLTLQQTHLIENEGQSDVLKTEEHFTSEIKSFVVVNPPKFKQVKKRKEIFILKKFAIFFGVLL